MFYGLWRLLLFIRLLRSSLICGLTWSSRAQTLLNLLFYLDFLFHFSRRVALCFDEAGSFPQIPVRLTGFSLWILHRLFHQSNTCVAHLLPLASVSATPIPWWINHKSTISICLHVHLRFYKVTLKSLRFLLAKCVWFEEIRFNINRDRLGNEYCKRYDSR